MFWWSSFFIISIYWSIYFCRKGFFLMWVLLIILTAHNLSLFSRIKLKHTLFNLDDFSKSAFPDEFVYLISPLLEWLSNIIKFLFFTLHILNNQIINSSIFRILSYINPICVIYTKYFNWVSVCPNIHLIQLWIGWFD